jgi:hypothetical protein
LGLPRPFCLLPLIVLVNSKNNNHMFENLLKLVTEHAQDAIVNNNAVPNEHNQAAIQEVTNSIHSGLAEQVSGGNIQDIMKMFAGGGSGLTSNPIVQNIIQSATGSISSKLGVDPAQASGIASSLIPQVMSQLSQQTADPNNSSFDMNGIMQSLSGGNGAGGINFNDILSKVQSGGGGIDFGGIASQLLGGGGGGIGSMIGNLLK